MRGGGTASTTTSPGAFTAEQRGDATRFGDSSGRALQIRNPLAPAAKVTPNQGDISRVINNNRGGIKICYQRALLRDNSLTHGKIGVKRDHRHLGPRQARGHRRPAAVPRRSIPASRRSSARWVFPQASDEYGTEFVVRVPGQ